jgi:hypothetical protein
MVVRIRDVEDVLGGERFSIVPADVFAKVEGECESAVRDVPAHFGFKSLLLVIEDREVPGVGGRETFLA